MAKTILFVCTENACRSQMAEGFFNHLNKDQNMRAISAGLKPVQEINPKAVDVMRELDIDTSQQKPKLLTIEMAEKADKIITMGCIKACPITLEEKTIDWDLEDPAGKPIEKFREVRDIIKEKINKLI